MPTRQGKPILCWRKTVSTSFRFIASCHPLKEAGSQKAPSLGANPGTRNIRGPEGLFTFCEYRPKIFEAVLNIVTDDQVATGARKVVLKDMEPQLLEAVNYSLPGEPVSSIDASVGRSVSEFGKEIGHTNRIYHKLHG